MRYESNPPDAASLMMSARSFGNYDLPSALADLIDNSIKAGARRVWISCLFRECAPEVRTSDDGEGMPAAALFAAMRPASTNPQDERSPDDLGRFGWGLKSASFSQCRKLTVLSARDGMLSGAEWDLDLISGWSMGILDGAEANALADDALARGDGTEVIWRKCDRLSEHGRIRADAFNELVAHARQRLALLFQRFLMGENGAPRLDISVNGQPVTPFDPFHRENNATQTLAPESIHLPGGAVITIRGYILPHFSKLALADHDRLGGEEGFVRNQGFYIYRNNRLIVNGTWFRLVRHGELSQLVRIAIDVPNSLDDMWKITVDKADAQLPSLLRERLKAIIANLRRSSADVFRSRGGRLNTRQATQVWNKHARGGQIRYSINREHPLVAALLDHEDRERARAAGAAISIIEQNFPAITIGEDVIRSPDAMNQSAVDLHAFKAELDASLPMLLGQAGSVPELVALLKVTEPWSSHHRVVEEHLAEKGWLNAARK